MYEIELEIAIEASLKAGKEILEIYKTDFKSETKADNSPVTIADKNANDIIVNLLTSKFPDYSVLAEESEDDITRLENTYCWIVDPLDGTKEFIKKNGEFTVNIALAKDGKPVLGVIYIPVTDELYYAKKDSGAFYRYNNKDKQIHVSNRKKDLIVVKSKSHSTEKLTNVLSQNSDKIAEIKPVGSSIKGCHIAHGKADLYYKFGFTCEWDTAAMQCIVEEAGGTFKQMDSTEMTYNREDTLNRKGFYVINSIDNKLDINIK